MTVGSLIFTLEQYLRSDIEERYFDFVFVTDDYSFEDTTIDCVYYRNGEIVLQSNETDIRNWSLIIPYVIHCLKFFKKDLEVCLQISDEDLDYTYYDIESARIIEDAITQKTKFMLYCSLRD